MTNASLLTIPTRAGIVRAIVLLLLSLWLYRQIMRVDVTFQAFGEAFMYRRSMRFIMASLTAWNLAVSNVTACAMEVSMFGMIGL